MGSKQKTTLPNPSSSPGENNGISVVLLQYQGQIESRIETNVPVYVREVALSNKVSNRREISTMHQELHNLLRSIFLVTIYQRLPETAII